MAKRIVTFAINTHNNRRIVGKIHFVTKGSRQLLLHRSFCPNPILYSCNANLLLLLLLLLLTLYRRYQRLSQHFPAPHPPYLTAAQCSPKSLHSNPMQPSNVTLPRVLTLLVHSLPPNFWSEIQRRIKGNPCNSVSPLALIRPLMTRIVLQMTWHVVCCCAIATRSKEEGVSPSQYPSLPPPILW
jgi:hypothetical protein